MGWPMVWFPVAACIALLGAIVARLSIPPAHRRHLRLTALEAEVAAEVQALDQARQMLDAVEVDIRNIDVRFAELSHDIPRLKEELGAIRRRPIWPAREIMLSEGERARLHIVRVVRGNAGGVWAVPNYLLIYADTEAAAIAAAAARFPATQGYELAFATTTFDLAQRHRDRQVQFAAPRDAAVAAASA